MDLYVDRTDPRPLATQLYEQVRAGIDDGRLRPGDPLSPTRQLAEELGIARHTVTTAYGRLTAEGFLIGRAGGGSTVAAIATSDTSRSGTSVSGTWVASNARHRSEPKETGSLKPVARLIGWSGPPTPDETGIRFDMRPGRPDPSIFPFDPWRRAVARAAAAPVPDAEMPAGTIGLRRSIAQWVARSRSVVADERTVVVTTGSQHAIDAACRVLVSPGDIVAVENPGFVHVRPLFHALGVRVVPVDVDDDGLVVERIPSGARIVFVTPSHQYPLGVTMSLQRRRALLAWAVRHRAAIIEDDFESEFRYADRPLEPLQRVDEHGHVIYVGSFWKTMSPAVRVGFAVVPPSLVGPMTALLQATDCVPSPTIQLALRTLIDGGELDHHLRRARRMYQARHRVLVASLDQRSGGALAGLLTLIPSNSGLHLTARLDVPADEGEVVAEALRRGVAISGLSRHYHSSTAAQTGLVMGFGSISAAMLPAAIDTVAATITDVARRRAT